MSVWCHIEGSDPNTSQVFSDALEAAKFPCEFRCHMFVETFMSYCLDIPAVCMPARQYPFPENAATSGRAKSHSNI
jgi:hypothetical protein